MKIRLGYVIVYVLNVDEILEFYQAAFGFAVRLRYEQDGQVDYGVANWRRATLY